MTISNNGCESMVLTSTLFSNYKANTSNRTLTLESYINCCTDKTISITVDADDITDDTYIIDKDFYSLSALPDGVFYFKLKLTENDSSYNQEVACSILTCNLQCDVISLLAENPDSKVNYYYQALTYAQDCDQCACEAACDIYKLILKELRDSDLETNVNTDCGC